MSTGGVYSIMGFNREKLECDETGDMPKMCYFAYPNKLIREKGIQDCAKDATSNCDAYLYDHQKTDFIKVIVALTIFIILFRLLAYCIMRYRLKHWDSQIFKKKFYAERKSL